MGRLGEHERAKDRPSRGRHGESRVVSRRHRGHLGPDELGRGPTGTTIRTGQVRVARDIVAEASYLPWRASAARHGLASSISLPLLEDGVAFGALMVYAPEPEAFGDVETELLVELADDLAFGIRSCANDPSEIGSPLPWINRRSP